MTLKSIFPLVWISAFLCGLFFINDWQLELFGAAIIFVFVWSVMMLSSRSGQGFYMPRSWVLRLMGLFWLAAFLSVFRSDILNVSLMAFCFFTVMPLTFLVFVARGDEGQFAFIGKILGVIFAGLSIWALLQFFVFSDYFAGRARHPLMNPNSLAALFNLAFFCSVGWLMGTRKKAESYGALLLSVLIFGGIMATGSRGALFSMLPVMVFFFFMMRDQVRERWRALSMLLVLCLCVFGLSYFGAVENDNLIARVSDTFSSNLKDVSSNRFALWAATFEMIKTHGLWGTGIGTYFLYFPEFRLSEDMSGAYYAHSDPLQYWVELGVAGFVLFYAFIVAVVARAFLALRKAKDVSQRLLILTPFCALGVVIFHTHVTFNLYNLSILLGVGFLLSVWFWATQNVLLTRGKEMRFPESYSFAARVFAIALPFVFIGTLFMAYIVSEHFTNKARDHLFAGELDAFADDVILANQISFNGNYRSYLLAVNVPLTLLEESGNQLNEAQKEEIFNQGLSYLRHVRNINPRSSSALYYLAKIQQLAPQGVIPKDLKSSEEYYRAALGIDPLHLGARMELSHIYDRAGDKPKALGILEEGFSYHYSSARALDFYGRLAKIYLQKGDDKGRKKALEKMRVFQLRLNKSQKKQEKSLYEHLF